MAKALIINGAEIRENPTATGRFNKTLFETLKKELAPHYTLLTTEVKDGYNVTDEQRKFQQADFIIFQTPIFWFSVPSSLKKYIDDLYLPGVFFGHSEQYGRGGLFSGKRYMLSTTWNAKLGYFDSTGSILDGLTPDEVLLPFHITQQYIGLRQLPSFSEHDVVRNPDPEGAAMRLKEHLERHIIGTEGAN